MANAGVMDVALYLMAPNDMSYILMGWVRSVVGTVLGRATFRPISGSVLELENLTEHCSHKN